eukprot:CAMPEP_0197829386 /NCGR_PEP_ID=MMETSP1437-20131217/5827_1 /TAXON_ID=49252 ORGANISM="Eucampia antarctica, Strain CCMP1452" /NCGR_SAMPLE_ID=MMETSP1437 /ASSEMBLY_ACC=CAM_ASM_001096 /LENGTH=222 /DNA_ID=CAMNT_0043431017 /DNA_START=336 /DNA_END=1004 /DNA_ORIENTATION=+
MDAWISILEQVPNSILCLLENPKEALPNLQRYLRSKNIPKHRVTFVPWQQNPFDFQKYNHDLCHVVLDTHPYNGHTTAQDAMYGGVPLLTRSDGLDMASRVTTSANILLGLQQPLNAPSLSSYIQKAVHLATNTTLYQQVRTQLIQTALQPTHMHPYWDMPRYVRNLEQGWFLAWDAYVNKEKKTHIYIQDDGHATTPQEIQTLDDNKEQYIQQRLSSSSST